MQVWCGRGRHIQEETNRKWERDAELTTSAREGKSVRGWWRKKKERGKGGSKKEGGTGLKVKVGVSEEADSGE